MKERWFISDTHFYHANILTFQKADGHKCRSEFSSTEEMNETMVERWNARVKPGDSVWHLGDVAMGVKENSNALHDLLQRLNGRKDLVVGNHDSIKSRLLQENFRRMELWKRYGHNDLDFGMTLSHIPLRLDQLRANKRVHINLHGHIHDNLIDDPHYVNVCVEHTNYAPIHLDEIIQIVRDRGIVV